MAHKLGFDRTEVASGLVFIAIGAWFGITSLTSLRLGSTFQMGPGYFPLVLSILLITLGSAIALKPVAQKMKDVGPPIPWRGLILVGLAPVFVALTVRGLGLAPALFIATAFTSFASRRMTPLLALGLAAGLTVFCVALFSYGLRLPIQVIGPWLQP